MIRYAKADDAPAIHALLKDILQLHKKMYPDRFIGEAKYDLEGVINLINGKHYVVFVSDNEGVDGYIILKDEIDVLFIDDLCVKKTKRGTHIGRELVEQAIAYAKRHHFIEVQLNVWMKNEAALHFYEKLGFTPLRTIYTMDVGRDR